MREKIRASVSQGCRIYPFVVANPKNGLTIKRLPHICSQVVVLCASCLF
jgi:hypothetical protein